MDNYNFTKGKWKYKVIYGKKRLKTKYKSKFTNNLSMF